MNTSVFLSQAEDLRTEVKRKTASAEITLQGETGSELKRTSVAKHEDGGKVGQTNWISQQEDGDV